LVLALIPIASLKLAPAGAADAYAPTPALIEAVGKEDEVAFCAGKDHMSVPAYVRKWYEFATTVLANGTTIYTASGGGPCLNGAANIGLFGYVASGPAYRRVLSTYAIRWKFRPDGTAVIDGHDSAAVSVRTMYTFDGTSYRQGKSEYLYEPTGETKPMSVPVHFANGTSSATVSGKVRAGFGDTYTLEAQAGQTLTVRAHATSGTLGDLQIFSSDDQVQLANGSSMSWRGKLPQSGTYKITIDALADDNNSPATYTMTIAVQ
jgi:hypothetical protein